MVSKSNVNNNPIFKVGILKAKQPYNKSTPDLKPIFERNLGEFIHPDKGYPVYTSFKLYCKEPDWEHPNFTYKIQMNNGASNTPVFTSISPTELHELVSGIIYWLKENNVQHSECIERSRDILKRKEIAKQYTTILSDPTMDTEELENNFVVEATKKLESKKLKGSIANFIKYFYAYFETNNPLHKRQCLDYMLSLLPEHTDDVLNMINLYKEHPELIEQDKDRIKGQLHYFFDGDDIKPDNLEQQFNIT